MDDLVTRLRAHNSVLMHDAADEIARLTAALAEARRLGGIATIDMIEARDQRNAARLALAEAEAERDAWRKAMQSWTPGGSEFTTPEACSSFVAMRRESEHEAKCAKVRAMRALAEAEAERDAMKEALGDAVLQLRYLHERGPRRGTTEATIVRAEGILSALTRPAAQPEGGE